MMVIGDDVSVNVAHGVQCNSRPRPPPTNLFVPVVMTSALWADIGNHDIMLSAILWQGIILKHR